MRLTDRDRDIIGYLETMKIASTDTIHELFFKPTALQICQRRLKKLYDAGLIRRCRDHFTFQYMYYILKPKQLKHDLLLTDFHRELSKLANVVDFRKEFSIENLRSDGLVAYTYNNNNYIAFVEVHIKNTNADIEKYIRLFESKEYEKMMPVFPKVIIISNRSVNKVSEFEIIKVKEDLSDINKILK